MRILVNNQEIVIPSSVSEITLKQKIDFLNTHGKDLEEMAKSIMAMPDGYEKELETTQFHFEQMFKTMSFFTGISEDVLKESEFIDKIAGIYYSSLAQLHVDEEEILLQNEFTWREELWEIAHPELKHGDRMTFGELIDAKQIIQDMVELGKNRWECMLPLCTIFLRRKGEAYDKSFLYEGSDRLKLMESLPLDIAIQVGFFLISSLNLSITTFQSSPLQELKEADDMLKSISNNSDGLTS